MNPETINSIKEALAPVAEKIGQGAEYGWEVLVAGQFAEGVARVGLWALALLIAISIFIYSTRGSWSSDGYEPMSRYGASAIFAFVALFILAMTVPFNGFVAIISPEYAALKFLISLGGA